MDISAPLGEIECTKKLIPFNWGKQIRAKNLHAIASYLPLCTESVYVRSVQKQGMQPTFAISFI